MSIVPAAIVAIVPMQNATFMCNKIKKKYFSWLTKYSVTNCIRSGWDTFIDKLTSNIFIQHWKIIDTIIPQIPAAKKHMIVILIFVILFLKILFYHISCTCP